MHSQAYLAAACALLSVVAAQGGQETVTHIDYVTELVTSTVWVDPSDPRANQTPAPVASASTVQHDVISEHQSHSHGGQHSHGHESSSSSVFVAPSPSAAPSSSSSVFVPPPPPAATPSTSSSVFVAPPPPPPATSSTSVVAPAPAPVETHATTPTTVSPPPAAPTTSTAAANAPAQVAPSSSSPAAAATQGSSSGSGKPYENVKLTFYGPEGGLGSCGTSIQDTDIAVAVSAATMDKATMCGKMITLSLPGHPTIQAKVVDTCPGCPAGGLDLTSSNTIAKGAETGAWAALKLTNDLGPQTGASWYFNN